MAAPRSRPPPTAERPLHDDLRGGCSIRLEPPLGISKIPNRYPWPLADLDLQATQPVDLDRLFLAEEERFELPVAFTTAVFKTAALDHSATPPSTGDYSTSSRSDLQRFRRSTLDPGSVRRPSSGLVHSAGLTQASTRAVPIRPPSPRLSAASTLPSTPLGPARYTNNLAIAVVPPRAFRCTSSVPL